MEYSIDELKEKAKEVRIDCIKMLAEAGSGHPGGSLSTADLLTALFFNKIKRTKENASSPDRHRFVLSKGHGVPTLYAIFAQIGILSKEDLLTLRKTGSILQGHPDYSIFPYVEASTGSLGQGLSIAQGYALAAKLDKSPARTYCLLGDGEIQEGQVWEAIMSAPMFKLSQLCVILDYNKGQIDGSIEEVMGIEPLEDKLKAFNWHVITIDGHNFKEILAAYDEAETNKDKPTFIIANTIKGRGVSFMEGRIDWHGSAPNKDQARQAIEELSAK